MCVYACKHTIVIYILLIFLRVDFDICVNSGMISTDYIFLPNGIIFSCFFAFWILYHWLPDVIVNFMCQNK